MIWTLAVILFVLWLLGAFAFHVGGGLIHILLVLAVIVILYRLDHGAAAYSLTSERRHPERSAGG